MRVCFNEAAYQIVKKTQTMKGAHSNIERMVHTAEGHALSALEDIEDTPSADVEFSVNMAKGNCCYESFKFKEPDIAEESADSNCCYEKFDFREPVVAECSDKTTDDLHEYKTEEAIYEDAVSENHMILKSSVHVPANNMPSCGFDAKMADDRTCRHGRKVHSYDQLWSPTPGETVISSHNSACHDQGEMSFSRPITSTASFASLAYAVPYSGSNSLRSDSSTTSAHSFAFPVLQTEWTSSPMKMVEPHRRSFRKHRIRMKDLLCCKF